jgi:acetoin utilization deacetylase AcuC-like enzyme
MDNYIELGGVSIESFVDHMEFIKVRAKIQRKTEENKFLVMTFKPELLGEEHLLSIHIKEYVDRILSIRKNELFNEVLTKVKELKRE